MPLIIYTTPEERSAVAMRDEFALLGLQALRSERALRSLRSQLDELAPSTPSNTSVVDLRLSLRTEPSGCTAEAMALVLLWMHTQGHCDRAMASSFKSGLSTYYERIAYVSPFLEASDRNIVSEPTRTRIRRDPGTSMP